jgi:hypothetical protein
MSASLSHSSRSSAATVSFLCVAEPVAQTPGTSGVVGRGDFHDGVFLGRSSVASSRPWWLNIRSRRPFPELAELVVEQRIGARETLAVVRRGRLPEPGQHLRQPLECVARR